MTNDMTLDDERHYRCGWCGHPTDSEGEPLSPKEIESWVESKSELLNGRCCPNGDL